MCVEISYKFLYKREIIIKWVECNNFIEYVKLIYISALLSWLLAVNLIKKSIRAFILSPPTTIVIDKKARRVVKGCEWCNNSYRPRRNFTLGMLFVQFDFRSWFRSTCSIFNRKELTLPGNYVKEPRNKKKTTHGNSTNCKL